MRLVNGDVNVYYTHDTLTPSNVRAASYGTASTSAALVPEIGDILRDFPGWTGTQYEPITVRVVSVETIGKGVEAYQVRTTTITETPAAARTDAEYEIQPDTATPVPGTGLAFQHSHACAGSRAFPHVCRCFKCGDEWRLTPTAAAQAPNAGAQPDTCRDCDQPITLDADGVSADDLHDHCGPLPHTGPPNGPRCELCR